MTSIRKLTFAAAILVVVAAQPAQACRFLAEIVLDDVRFADVVLVGRIADYRIIRDEAYRQQMLSSPTLPPALRELYEKGTSLLTDYARFDIEVSEVLVGTAPSRLSVTWDNSTYNEPETLPAGPYLIALRNPSSPAPPLRGPSATVFSNAEPGLPTLLQAPCASPFMFENHSDQAAQVRQILETQPR